MKFPGWVRHGLILAACYWAFSFVSVFLAVFAFRGQILTLVSGANKEVAVWLGDDSDERMQKRLDGLRKLKKAGPTVVGDLWIVDETGKIYATTSEYPLPDFWREAPLPTEPLEPALYDMELFSKRQLVVILLRSHPARYMVSASLSHIPEVAERSTMGRIIEGSRYYMIWYILGTAFLSTFTVLYVFRHKAKQAGRVMTAIATGDLKARFVVSKVDEIGGLMARFNSMAETIESLVNRLKAAEAARVSLLQELNHDLRTPLTSLHLMVETMTDHHARLTAKKREGLIKDIGKELDYVTRLVQFLFSLSDMAEASYRVDFAKEDIRGLVKEEIAHRKSSPFPGGKPMQWSFEAKGPTHCFVDGDRSLLGRLVRNTLDNASKFASGKVHMRLTDHKSVWTLECFDDGPGPSEVALKSFGRRPAKPHGLEVLKPAQSVGLGSAIMLAVAELHGGSVTLGKADAPWGAVLTVTLPKGKLSSLRRAA